MARPLALKRNIDYRYTADGEVPVVLCDWEALRKVVTNIVGNALKYTDEGGSVEVRASYDTVSEQLRISIADTGVGIRQEDLGRIFESFSQISEATKDQKRNGSGLGLSVAANLVKLMGGTLDVSSVFGEGSEFVVSIPTSAVEDED